MDTLHAVPSRPAVHTNAVADASESATVASTVDSESFVKQARALIDLSASLPHDAANSDLRPIFPSGHKSFDGEVGQGRIAILAMCLRHIAQTGDGELSFFLGDCLQHVPDCIAYLDALIEFDTALINGHVLERTSGGLVFNVLKDRDVSGEFGRRGIGSVAHANDSGVAI